MTFSRAGFTGAGRAPCHWAGDEDSTWEAFRASITAGLTAGASGVPFWGWDLAGFSGEIPSVELYLRATAMAALCPIMQYHSEFNHDRTPSNDRTPWNIAERHGDDRAIDLYRRFAVLRERLIPYLVAAAERTVASGMPLMRALCFDHPDDPTIWDAPHAVPTRRQRARRPGVLGRTRRARHLPPRRVVGRRLDGLAPRRPGMGATNSPVARDPGVPPRRPGGSPAARVRRSARLLARPDRLMHPDDYRRFTSELTRWAQSRADVLGLVAVGSTADASHAPDDTAPTASTSSSCARKSAASACTQCSG